MEQAIFKLDNQKRWNLSLIFVLPVFLCFLRAEPQHLHSYLLSTRSHTIHLSFLKRRRIKTFHLLHISVLFNPGLDPIYSTRENWLKFRFCFQSQRLFSFSETVINIGQLGLCLNSWNLVSCLFNDLPSNFFWNRPKKLLCHNPRFRHFLQSSVS